MVEVHLTTPLTSSSTFVTPTLSLAEKATLRLPLTKEAAVGLRSTNSLGRIHTTVAELLIESNCTEVILRSLQGGIDTGVENCDFDYSAALGRQPGRGRLILGKCH